MVAHDSAQRCRGDRDAGAVTVEAALGICSIVTAFALALGGMSVMIGQLRCTDAAIEAARLVARGDRDRASEAVRRVAPTGATLRITVRGDEITTEVAAQPLKGVLPDDWLRGRAFAVMEPGRVATPTVPAAGTSEEEGTR